MRRIYRLSLLFLSTLGVFTACSVDELNENPIGNGSAEVSLTFFVNDDRIVDTKAAQPTYYEYLVQNIYIFMFLDNQRVKTSTSFFEPSPSSSSIGQITSYEHKEADGKESGVLTFETATGQNMILCAVANIGTSNSVLDTKATTSESGSSNVVTEDDIACMDAIKTYDELKALSVSLDEESIFRGASFLMTGEVPINLSAGQNLNVEIPLKRADSKITFNVSAAARAANIKDMKFIPGKWRVVNVPKRTWVLPPTVTAGATLDEDLDATTEASHFCSESTIGERQFEGAVANTENSGTFTFYMYENLKTPKQNITDTDNPNYTTTDESAPLYALREKQTKTAATTGVSGQQYVNGDYVYAPKFATYVVFTGELSYTDTSDEEEKYVIADVEYSVHLGYETDNVNDYSTLRNSHYTYNVTITGVNSIVVEVDNDQEERPGAEGDVVQSAAEIINVDGHYDRALITLTAEEAQKIYFAVSTPFERGLDANGFQVTETLKDYKWVKFLINSDVDLGEKVFAPFPGEQCYDGGKTSTGTAATSTVYKKDVTLRDIRQLSTYLNQNSPTAETAITVFVDEYLYFYDPTKDPLGESTTYKSAYTATTSEELLMWKKSVNQNDRMLHIVKAGDMKYSTDGESSVSRSVVTIKQKPILTFYNANATGLTTAWGTETVNETPKMVVTRTLYPATTNYNYYQQAQRLTAYYNTSTQNTWSTTISSSEKYGLGTNRQDPSYACALRNRDFDGDGYIDTDEVQWYLASLNQLSDLWIGEPCMPTDYWLYNETEPDGKYSTGGYIYNATHYVTSTISGSSPMVYWAEEYGCSSSHDNAIKWRQAPSSNSEYQTKYINSIENLSDEQVKDFRQHADVSLRCVRNLGIATNNTALPQDYVIVSNGTVSNSQIGVTSNNYHLNFDYINPTALRSVPDNGNALPNDLLNTLTENNRPYVSIEVYSNTNLGTNSSFTWDHISQYNKSNELDDSSICPKGYRIPNQRELLVMSRSIDGWQYWDNTWNGWWPTGWYLSLNHQIVESTSSDGTKYYQLGAFLLRTDNFNITRAVGTATESSTAISGPPHNGFRIRCVKDNIGYTPPSSASTYEDGGDITQ